MKLLAVCAGLPVEIEHDGKTVSTGIFKKAVAGRVMLRRGNLDGDRQADLANHGGEFKAAYAYPHEHYAFWQHQLGRNDFTWGQFGENFTVEGLTEESVLIGDVYRIGGAVVQVTQPRVPCFKLGIKLADPAFPRKFLASGKLGFYLRVVQEGEVGAGDPIKLVLRGKTGISVRRVWELVYCGIKSPEEALRAAEIELLSESWRKALAKLAASDPD
ncbi:MAG: MOSC domain-containing protein [Candidatus Glassbacteria bacterium]